MGLKEIKNFERKELLDHYHNCDNPFIILTTKIEITNVVNYCKKHRNFYATFGFIITQAVNQIDAFKYRYKDGKVYYCDEVKSNYTQIYEDNRIGYFDVQPTNDFDEYIENFKDAQKKLIEDKQSLVVNDLNEIWLSCVPWFSFTSFVPPFSKEVSIPQFIWDKYENIDGKYYIDLMIMVHHGFADGFHIGQFIHLLEKNISSFN